MLSLKNFSASSGGNIFSEEVIKSGSLSIHASSAGTIEIGAEADRIDVSASSAGQVEIVVKQQVSMRMPVVATSKCLRFASKEGRPPKPAAAAIIKVSVTDDIMANASSGGSARYRGDPSKSMTD